MSLPIYARLVSRGSAALVGTSVLSLSAAEYSGSDSGLVRSFRFWKGMLPIYMHYKYVEWSVKDIEDPAKVSAAYRPLNERYSPRVEKLTLDLKGFYFKLAQVVSTRDEFLPDEYIEWTKKLQDKSPAVIPSQEVKDIVENSMKMKTEELFSEWDDEPIGAASIAQVHRARLRRSGEMVAVKVQYPGIERKFRADMDTVESFCKYLMPQNTAFFKEIKKQFVTEFDARGEAANLQLVRDNLYRAGWDKLVDVPKAVHSTKEVLIMSYLPGPKLVDGVREQFRKMAQIQGKDFEELEREQKELMQSGKLKRKEIAASVAESRRISRLLWVKDFVWNTMIFAGNWTIRPLIRREKWEYVRSDRPVNLGEVIDTLVRVHGHEVFVDGSFNADCHPGNVLLMPDGRLGLIDYGQVKRMKVEDRIIYAKLILALHREDKEEVVRIMTEEVGFQTKNMDKDVIYRNAAFFNCRDSDDVTMGMNVSEFMEWLEKTDPVQHINDEFVMVGRLSILMRGMANAFGLKLRVSDYWKEEAERFLKSHGISY